jgi:phospholipid transport system substrate-binding protein
MIVYLAVPSRAVQEDVASPLTKVRTTLANALAILHNQNMPVEQRRRALQQLAQRNLDLQRMARESLSDHWNELSPADRDEFVPLFGAFIEEAYLIQIQNFSELDIAVSKARLSSTDYAQVNATAMQPHEEALPITFMLERRGDDWSVYDVTVEGVSIVHNYRTQFDRVIERQGLRQLLTDLKAKQKQLAVLIGQP